MKKSYIYAVISVLVWSTNAPTVKVLLGGIPSMQALFLSSAFAFLFMASVNLRGGFRKAKEYSLRQYGMMAALGFVGLFVYSALYYFGLTQLTAQEGCILNYLWPLMLVLFSCLFMGEKLTPLKVGALLSSFLGIVILSAGGGGKAGGNALLGMASCIGGAVCYGLFSALNKKAAFDQNICMSVVWLITAVCSLIAGLMTETWVPMTGGQWMGMLWLGVVVDGLAYLLWALSLEGAANTAAIANLAYLTPFLAVIVSAVFLKEGFQPRALIALVFIVGGILVQSLFDRATPRRRQ